MKYLCRNLDKHTGHISKIYNMLTSASTKLFYMNKYEHDINEMLEVEDWCKMAQRMSKTLINTSLIEANYKVFLR